MMSGGPFRRRPECVFCQPDQLPPFTLHHGLHGHGMFMAFEPLNPVTPGHMLIVPRRHVESAAADPGIAGAGATVAAQYAATLPAANIITSVGAEATQTVRHLHWHVVPRREGDGLPLPWTPQQARARQ